MRDIPTLNLSRHVKLKLREDEYNALLVTLEQNRETYASKTEFIRKAVLDKMKELGTYVVEKGRPRIVRMDLSYRMKTFAKHMKENPNEWMKTRDIIDRFTLDRSHVHRILNRMEAEGLITSKYRKEKNVKIKLWKWVKKRPLTSSQIDVLRELDDNGNWQPATMFNRNTVLSLIKRGNIEREGDFIRLKFKVKI